MSGTRPGISERIAFIGFGEAAQAFVQGWRGVADVRVSAYDIKTDDPASRAAKLADCARLGVAACASHAAAVDGADVIISAVTADQAEVVAAQAAQHLRPGQLYLDINSVAPGAKRRSAERVQASGAAYVDVAVMAPVHPPLHRVPLLVGGPGAQRLAPLLERLDARFEVLSDEVGAASTVKMVRSVMIKGLEALAVECGLAAVRAGIDARIIDSLDKSYPGMQWRERFAYMLERVVVHGARRAAEMREVALTMDELGIGGIMSTAIAERQQGIADLALAEHHPDGLPSDFEPLARAIIAALPPPGSRNEPREF